MAKENSTFQVLFLDADRNPIKEQSYKLYFNGAMISARTGPDGLTKKIKTKSSADEVQIAIERLDKSIKVVARVFSGVGNKLVTLISPKIKVTSSTLPHSAAIPGQVPSKKEVGAPIYDSQKPKEPTAKKDFGTTIEPRRNSVGNPVSKVEGDIPNLEFLDEFNGEIMTNEDYLWASKRLGIEFAAIKAFAIVESKGKGFFKIRDRTVPKILYERHKFAAFTDNEFSKLNPDISSPCGYYYPEQLYVPATSSHKKKKKIPEDIDYYRSLRDKDDEETKAQARKFKELVKDGTLDRSVHAYFDGIGSYRRLIKAYKLNPEAALASCSWGSFQIMGEYWKTMGYKSVTDFSKSMSRSPKDQVKAFVLYIELVNPKIKNYLRARDWEAAAKAYNGPSYLLNKYHIKIKEAYEKFKREES